jgi:predicted small secreted protein
MKVLAIVLIVLLLLSSCATVEPSGMTVRELKEGLSDSQEKELSRKLFWQFILFNVVFTGAMNVLFIQLDQLE